MRPKLAHGNRVQNRLSPSPLRDEFAMFALMGLVISRESRIVTPQNLARMAYALADAMMLERGTER